MGMTPCTLRRAESPSSAIASRGQSPWKPRGLTLLRRGRKGSGPEPRIKFVGLPSVRSYADGVLNLRSNEAAAAPNRSDGITTSRIAVPSRACCLGFISSRRMLASLVGVRPSHRSMGESPRIRSSSNCANHDRDPRAAFEHLRTPEQMHKNGVSYYYIIA